MAAKGIEQSELTQAAKEYCELHQIQMIEVPVSLKDGKIVCEDANIKEALTEIIMDLRTPEKAIVPAKKPSKPPMTVPGGMTTQDVINYINPKATESEAYLFAEFCRRKGADPMTKQVYLVIYEGQNGRQANFIAGKEYFTEKAEAHPQFDGFQAGIIIRSKEGALERREGTFWIKEEEALVGGWAKVHRKDRKIASGIEVPFKDFDTGKNLWAKMPATMIRKVALVQALREAFPANFGGMYDRSEMDQAIPADYEVQGT
jgi:phage recombination protein Bet